MPDYVFPTSTELIEIAQEKIPMLSTARAGFDILPMRSVDQPMLIWEQRDNYTGLQQARGLGGRPTRVTKVGAKRYMMEPGYYGEFQEIDEREITTRRQFATWNTPINITDLVMEAQDQLLGRRLDRVEQIIWSLLVTGKFSVFQDNVLMHTDEFPLLSYASVIPWSTQATSTPLQNFRDIQLLGRGKSVNFGAGATAYMNRRTSNFMLANTNNADLAGKRTSGLANVLSPSDAQTLLTGEGLFNLRIYDEGYLSEPLGEFVPFIPDNKIVVVGQRPAAQKVGEYRMTRNANNVGLQSGPYMKVIDRGEQQVPRSIEVHDGHNGGPVLFFPSSVIVMGV